CGRSLRRLPERKADEVVESRIRPEFVLCGVDCGARLGGLEAEVGERGKRVGGSSGSRSRCRAAKSDDPELALKLIGYTRRELGADPVGTADHSLVALADRAGELVGSERREDRQRQSAA